MTVAGALPVRVGDAAQRSQVAGARASLMSPYGGGEVPRRTAGTLCVLPIITAKEPQVKPAGPGSGPASGMMAFSVRG